MIGRHDLVALDTGRIAVSAMLQESHDTIIRGYTLFVLDDGQVYRCQLSRDTVQGGSCLLVVASVVEAWLIYEEGIKP